MVTSRSGIHWPSSNTLPNGFRRPGCGPRTRLAGRMPVRFRRNTTGAIRPDRLRDGNLARGQRKPDRWFDPGAFAVPGPFLFGNFGGADAMFAPVVHRFRTYAIEVAPEVQAYMDTIMSLPAFQEWTRAALAETLVIEKFETV